MALPCDRVDIDHSAYRVNGDTIGSVSPTDGARQIRNNANFVGDLATLKTNDTLPSPEAALRFAEDLARAGGRPAVGLLGVPLAWASRYGLPSRALFDTCTNIAVATAALEDHQAACESQTARGSSLPAAGWRSRSRRRATSRAARACLLAAFAKEHGLVGSAAAVLAAMPSAPSKPAPNDDEAHPGFASPVFPGGPTPEADDALRRSVFVPDPPVG